jgi:hypothetical protein
MADETKKVTFAVVEEVCRDVVFIRLKGKRSVKGVPMSVCPKGIGWRDEIKLTFEITKDYELPDEDEHEAEPPLRDIINR